VEGFQYITWYLALVEISPLRRSEAINFDVLSK
jgi:hypothetical protein